MRRQGPTSGGKTSTGVHVAYSTPVRAAPVDSLSSYAMTAQRMDANPTRWSTSSNLGNPTDRIFQTRRHGVERGLLDQPSAGQTTLAGGQFKMAHGDTHIHTLQVGKPQ